jgi:hypothetical protein
MPEKLYRVAVTLAVEDQDSADNQFGPLVELSVELDGQEWRDVLAALRIAFNSAQIQLSRKMAKGLEG